jgi:hypothetical protein
MIYHEKDERKMKTSTKNQKKKKNPLLSHASLRDQDPQQIKHVFKARLQVIKLLSARVKSKHDQASKLSDDQAFKHVKNV